MAEQQFPYDMMVQEALRSVVRQSLTQVCKDGFRGEHHFYITFKTQAPNVALPYFLHQQYPQEMTIVVQYEYYDVKINNNNFSISLSFNDIKTNLIIDYNAIISFADPSANFGLILQKNKTQKKLKKNLESKKSKKDNVINFSNYKKN